MIIVGYILSCIGAFALGGWAAWGRYALADRLEARRKRLAAERATWAESVTKQTKPPPMAQDSTISIPLVVTYEDCSPGRRKAEAKALVDRALGIPSPTAPASARKVRAATKRRK